MYPFFILFWTGRLEYVWKGNIFWFPGVDKGSKSFTGFGQRKAPKQQEQRSQLEKLGWRWLLGAQGKVLNTQCRNYGLRPHSLLKLRHLQGPGVKEKLSVEPGALGSKAEGVAPAQHI